MYLLIVAVSYASGKPPKPILCINGNDYVHSHNTLSEAWAMVPHIEAANAANTVVL